MLTATIGGHASMTEVRASTVAFLNQQAMTGDVEEIEPYRRALNTVLVAAGAAPVECAYSLTVEFEVKRDFEDYVMVEDDEVLKDAVLGAISDDEALENAVGEIEVTDVDTDISVTASVSARISATVVVDSPVDTTPGGLEDAARKAIDSLDLDEYDPDHDTIEITAPIAATYK